MFTLSRQIHSLALVERDTPHQFRLLNIDTQETIGAFTAQSLILRSQQQIFPGHLLGIPIWHVGIQQRINRVLPTRESRNNIDTIKLIGSQCPLH